MNTRFRSDWVEIATKAAVDTWAGSEGALSRELRAMNVITEEFLRDWLGVWMLGRSNPLVYRKGLAVELSSIRPRILQATDQNLPELVSSLTAHLKHSQATKSRQTSLVSKFAFSLRPEVIVPYDSRGRKALGELFGKRLPNHDYSRYLAAFQSFSEPFFANLDKSGTTSRMRAQWEPIMSEHLFKLRSADKYFMLMGGFSVRRMSSGASIKTPATTGGAGVLDSGPKP